MVDESKAPLSHKPHIGVLSVLFPHSGQPQAGVFIRERMFRLADRIPVTVVSPQPWFPFQRLLRRWRPHFRPDATNYEVQQGVEVYRPRFLSVPGLMKSLDGFLLAVCAYPRFRRLQRAGRLDVIDAHFAYPDGYAAFLLGRWLGVPVSITLRGTEVPLARFPGRRKRMLKALNGATRVFSVAESLRRHVEALGVPKGKVTVVGNGVDLEKFALLDRLSARRAVDISPDAKVIISVGGLVERKGFHRVLQILPRLVSHYPNCLYLIVGGASAEGDWRERLEQLTDKLGVREHVRFLGNVPPDELKLPLSAADVFVLATSNEGWANVFLEAMACGLPVVTTDVGGNREVVGDATLGTIVPFNDSDQLCAAVRDALDRKWSREAIRRYAEENAWDRRVDQLEAAFASMVSR